MQNRHPFPTPKTKSQPIWPAHPNVGCHTILETFTGTMSFNNGPFCMDIDGDIANSVEPNK